MQFISNEDKNKNDALDNEKNSAFQEPIKPRIASEYFLPASILISTVILAAAWVYTESLRAKQASFQNATEKLAVQSSQNSGSAKPAVSENQLEEKILPSSGVVLPVRWGDLGKQMTESGVIDRKKFEAIYAQRGGLNEEAKELLYGTDNGYIKITEEKNQKSTRLNSSH